MDVDIPKLMSAADWWEGAGYIASGLVLIGIVIESVELLHAIRAKKFKEKLFEFAGLSIVILGLALEILAQVQSNNRTGIVIAALDAEARTAEARIADANKAAQKAAEDAAKLGVSVGDLHNFVDDQEGKNNAAIIELKRSTAGLDKARDDALGAAALSKKALSDMTAALEEERVVREKMMAVISPRDFTPIQKAEIKGRLSKFSPMRVDIITFGDTREIADFGRKLSEALQSAGWSPKLWSAFNGASYGVTGVPIFTRKDAPAKAPQVAAALESALIDQKISTKVLDPFEGTKLPVSVNGPNWDEADVADIRVFVGAKP
jgi:hypothetical protein